MQATLREVLRQERAKYPIAKLRASYNHKFNWRYPLNVESELRTKIHKDTKKIADAVMDMFVLFGDKAEQHKVRFDTDESELYAQLGELRSKVEKEAEDDNIFGVFLLAYVGSFFEKLTMNIENESKRFFAYYVKKEMPITIVGADFLMNHFGKEIRDRLYFFINNYFNKLYKLIGDYQSGKKNLGQMLHSVNDLNDNINKAMPAFIARDVIGTYISQMQGNVANTYGIKTYNWQTSLDEKVRGRPDGLYPKANPSHWDMQGVLCKNDDPSVYSDDEGKTWKPRYGRMPNAHPGEEPNCRCVRIYNMIPLLQSVDKELLNGRNS